MRYFIIELVYLRPLDEVQQHTDAHRQFLRGLYERQVLLVSGPAVPRDRGILIGRAESPEQMRELLAPDPYQTHGMVEPRIVEFAPANFLPALAGWLGKES